MGGCNHSDIGELNLAFTCKLNYIRYGEVLALATGKTSLIRLEQVSLTAPIGLHYLLRDISFEVFAGDRIVLVGASGSGKTSLLRLLNRLQDPTEGSIYLENQEIRQIPTLDLRSSVMLVPQEPKLLGMTVEDTLAYPLILRGVTRPVIQQRLSYWIEQLRIPSDWLDRNELQLSVGQRQLVTIARSLVTHPRILLLDEPTSALDPGRAEWVLQVLAQHREVTVVMVTHQLELAQRFCTRVLYLDQGELTQNAEAAHLDWGKLRDAFSQREQQIANEWS